MRSLALFVALLGLVSGLKDGCHWRDAIHKLAISGYNNVYLAGRTHDQCKAACEAVTAYNCRSIDYHVGNRGCYLSDRDTYDVPITTWTAYIYFEIVCDNDPRDRSKCPTVGPIKNLGISGQNIIIKDGLSQPQCDEACRKEPTFHCRSYDWYVPTQRCYMQIVDRARAALSTWNNYDYYEITCEKQGCPDGVWAGPALNLALTGYNKFTLRGTTVEACKQSCQNQMSFLCRSIEYNILTRQCNQHSETSATIPLSNWPNWQFHELSGCNGGPVSTLRTLSCYCVGDPHCHSFDGIWAHFMGTCKYTLARDNCKDGVPDGDSSWEVIINNNRNYPSESVARVREVRVVLDEYDLIIDMFSGKRVEINGEPSMAFPRTLDDDVVISRTSTNVILAVAGGISVAWDGNTRVVVSAPDDMKKNMCGICGDADGDTSNDWTIGDSDLCMDSFPNAKVGDKATNVNEFGFSWTAAIDENEASCKASCPNPPKPDECSGVKEQNAERHCAVLKDASGPFKDCLSEMNAAQAKDMYDNCVYDSCHLNDFENVVCDHGASMAAVCQGMFDLTISWRTADRCPMACGEGMEFKACGSLCMPTCKDPEGEGCGDLDGCQEGCFCKENMVYDGVGKCFAENKCGCKVPDMDNAFINVGESFMGADCKRHCACEEAGGDLICKDASCGTNEKCALVDGLRECICPHPFSSSGNECFELENPCEPDKAKLQCFSCLADSDDECDDKGKFVTCDEDKPICYHDVKTDRAAKVVKVERGCQKRSDCPSGSIGPEAEACEGNTVGETCTKCFYGKMNTVHKCEEPEDTNVCELKPDEGKGNKKLTRYFYWAKKKKCKTFQYQGTGGNGNNFESKEDCEDECKSAKIPKECLLPKDAGTCKTFKKVFYFDAKKGKCKKFNYGGCGGNDNRFKKKKDCSDTCKKY